MTEQELFEKLKRDGECWHRRSGNYAFGAIQCTCGFEFPYEAPFLLHCEKKNPDFSTPDGFFWLWERVWERHMFKAFLGECEISELDPHMSVETAVPVLFKHIVNPTHFTESLKEYLKGE